MNNYNNSSRPAWVEIDLEAIDNNIKNIKQRVGDTELLPVIKADAYGCGAVEVAKVLQKNGVKYFAVATLDEAIELRENGFTEDIYVMGIILNESAELAVQNRIMPIICSFDNAKAFSDASVKAGVMTKCFIAVDTGMSRIGFMHSDKEGLVKEVKNIAELDGLEIFGMHSHFAVADEGENDFTRAQIRRYCECYEALKENGINIPVRALANSAAITDYPEALFEMCRPGIIIYGTYPSDDVKKENLALKFAMSVKAKVTYVKEINPGDTVGYGRKFTAERPTTIATLPLGYVDGLPRTYSPYAKVLVNGKVAPMAGNVCMDQCMIDVTDIPGVEVGTEVVIMGRDGDNVITPEAIIEHLGNMTCEELMHGFTQRMTRKYKF